MTDKETLLSYRLRQAKETLSDAQKMLKADVGERSIVNRAYYAMFYSILALFIRFDISIKSSKHAGVISIFDREFVHAGKIKKEFSKILHSMFDARQEYDYKELVTVTKKDAADCVCSAESFLKEVETLITQ